MDPLAEPSGEPEELPEAGAGQKGTDSKMAQLFGERHDEFWLPQVQEVPVEELSFDSELAEGQIRVLDASAVASRVKSFQTVEPDDLLECRLWEADMTGTPAQGVI